MVDHSKFGQRALCKVLDTKQIHEIITDRDATADHLATLEQRGVAVRLPLGEFLPEEISTQCLLSRPWNCCRPARRGKYAVGYFESWDIASLEGVIDAAEQSRAPVIVGFNGEFLARGERIRRRGWNGTGPWAARRPSRHGFLARSCSMNVRQAIG